MILPLHKQAYASTGIHYFHGANIHTYCKKYNYKLNKKNICLLRMSIQK